MNEVPEIAMILSRAPKPHAPSHLKDNLVAEASKALHRAGERRSQYANQSWFRRWWPALAPAGISIACAMVLTVQQSQITDLKQRLEILAPSGSTESVVKTTPGSVGDSSVTPGAVEAMQENEADRLRKRSAQLTAEIAQLEALQHENENLRGQIAAASANRFTPDEMRAIDDAKRRAERIKCVNNLKQIGLAVKMWSLDNRDVYPPDLLSVSNELNTPIILFCPSDTNRVAATNFRSCTPANCSYEYYAGTNSDAQQVITHCRIHSNVGLSDGSVQQITPDRLEERDGKLYIGTRQ